MSFSDEMFLAFWGFQFIKVVGMFSGFFTRREILSLGVITSGLGLTGTIAWAATDGGIFSSFMVCVWSILFYVDYKVWKKHKDDDDDDHRKKRWSRLRNKLPKPKTKVIAQPT
jgi:hypothetical protein